MKIVFMPACDVLLPKMHRCACLILLASYYIFMQLICNIICPSHELPSRDPKIKFWNLKDLKGNGEYSKEAIVKC